MTKKTRKPKVDMWQEIPSKSEAHYKARQAVIDAAKKWLKSWSSECITPDSLKFICFDDIKLIKAVRALEKLES